MLWNCILRLLHVLRIVEDLKTMTGYQFFFQKDVITDASVTLTMNGATIEEIFDKLLPEHDLSYKIHGNVM